jgi:GTP-binding protein of the ras superfamily involved in termination of M-phase
LPPCASRRLFFFFLEYLEMGDHEFSAASNAVKKNSVVVKVGMVGDSQIGKTSLMVKYVEGTFDEDYIQTLGV